MKKRHGAEQIVALLRQADVSLGKGQQVPEVCKQSGISEQTYYRWRWLDRVRASPTVLALRKSRLSERARYARSPDKFSS